MNIIKATRYYEEWLAAALRPLAPVHSDLEIKHRYMAGDVYSFMRATYYRWAQAWSENEDDDFRSLNDAPTVLSVGDLHTDNFGSWRDSEARLVWGINDFDEAYHLPYPADLVRLTVSARLALEDGYRPMPIDDIAAHVLSGYAGNLKRGAAPIVLAEERRWLQDLITPNLKDAKRFWEKLTLPQARAPQAAIEAINRSLPEPGTPYRVSARTAGVGSLGRPRYVALMQFAGACAAREAKPLVDSAAALDWLAEGQRPVRIHVNEILDQAARSRDPYMREHGGWVVRRLSPDYVRVDLASLESEALVGQVLNAMGWETANIHARDHHVSKEIRKDLKERGKTWLGEAAGQMLAMLLDDFEAWQRHWHKIQE